ncbi:MAG: glycoside hydrolase family 99-like domain-containing protein [Chthoniobacteraceae bacterium]
MTKPVIGAYYFPNYHCDPRNEAEHGRGWTEWELVKHATPRFEGHNQPLVPLWGYEDESDPAVMAKKIQAAADHAVDFFIFDWYHYNDGEFLNRALDHGYLGASNNHLTQFALMWANHDWREIMPAKFGRPSDILYPGKVTQATMDQIADTFAEKYATHPSYFRIDGRAYFSIYEVDLLIAQAGGLREAAAQIERFRERVRARSGAELHLNGIFKKSPILQGEKTSEKFSDLVSELGLDSATSYVWIHHTNRLSTQTLVSFEDVCNDFMQFWHNEGMKLPVPYFPNVSMGWDASPRTVQSDKWEVRGYPFTGILSGNTPERFGATLRRMLSELRERRLPEMVTINAWNEWTEGSYLEPNTTDRFAYLEAIRDAVNSHLQSKS